MPDTVTMLAMEQLLGGLPGDEVQQAEAKVIATMPMRLGARFEVCRPNGSCSVLGVLGRRTAHDCWAATRELNQGEDLEGCLAEVSAVSWVDPVGPT